MKKNGLVGKVWQYFIAVPDVKRVGVKDGKRYEGWPAIIRAVNTTDAIEEIPYPLLHHITDRITHEVEGITRVLLDLTPKPIGTIATSIIVFFALNQNQKNKDQNLTLIFRWFSPIIMATPWQQKIR